LEENNFALHLVKHLLALCLFEFYAIFSVDFEVIRVLLWVLGIVILFVSFEEDLVVKKSIDVFVKLSLGRMARPGNKAA
jgi:hypothetical protein